MVPHGHPYAKLPERIRRTRSALFVLGSITFALYAVRFLWFTPGIVAYFETWLMMLLSPALICVALHLRDLHRRKRPAGRFLEYCTECEYDLTGNVSGICPECGKPIKTEVS